MMVPRVLVRRAMVTSTTTMVTMSAAAATAGPHLEDSNALENSKGIY